MVDKIQIIGSGTWNYEAHIDWPDQSLDYQGLADMFEEPGLLDKWYIVAGDHDGGSYDDSCVYVVINKENGLLQEVDSSHCSCSGYEGCWDPAVTDLDTLFKNAKLEHSAWRRDVYMSAIEFCLKNRKLFEHFGHEYMFRVVK